MASGSVWGIDLGKSSLKAVQLRKVKEELDIEALEYIEYDTSADGTVPPGEPSRALERLVADHPEIKKERVVVALAGHQSFSRFLKLPTLDRRQVDQMVHFEAQQQIPFPIADVVWDYAVIERDYEPGDEIEVGLFAIKREIVYAFLADLKLAGIEPDVLTIAPVALYNFARWDMELPEGKAALLLDIGSDHTDLVLIDSDRYWVRNLALNGHDLTKAIQAKFGIPFAEAEKKKREAATAKDNKKIFQATELVLKDFTGEIHRSIGFYKAQNKGRTIQILKAWLLGDGSKLPNVAPFFQKELGFAVQALRQVNNLNVVESDDIELLKEHVPAFAVAFGLAVQGAGEASSDVNLLPEEMLQQKALEKKKPLAIGAVAAAFGAFALNYFFATSQLEEMDAELKNARLHVAKLDANRAQLDALAAEADGLEPGLGKLVAVSDRRLQALELLNKLSRALPPRNGLTHDLTPAQLELLVPPKSSNRKAIEDLVKDLDVKMRERNDQKYWVLELKIGPQPAPGRGVRATLEVARLLQGDEPTTKRALTDTLVADLKRELGLGGLSEDELKKHVRFVGGTKRLSALDATAVAGAPGPGGASIGGGGFGAPGGFGAAAPAGGREYVQFSIEVDYPAPVPEAAPKTAGTQAAGASTASGG